MNKLQPAQLLAEVDDVLRTMPAPCSFGYCTPEHMAWLGRATALVHAWDPLIATEQFDGNITKMNSPKARDVDAGAKAVLTTLHQLRHDTLMRIPTAQSVSINAGSVFDYFDEVRKVIETAKLDILFVDPYLDAEFISRYLPHASTGVTIRLLAREKLQTLLPAVAMMRQQEALQIEVRSAPGFHDRYVFADQTTCYQSGASFKDGAKKAPTTLTQITDAFAAVFSTYEGLWLNGAQQP
ncbi:MAG: hypothetical protein H0X47_09810 [Nitrospirales bacterium]|nr:hypothetical protein [Nitrospirales bacterium]